MNVVCCREVWPEREEFGSQDISPEDEFMALREVFFADIPSEYRTFLTRVSESTTSCLTNVSLCNTTIFSELTFEMI